MPWRLIAFLAALALIVAFIGFNLGNSCNISFGFAEIEDVPVYLSILGAFLLGFLASIPLAFRLSRGRRAKAKKAGPTLNQDPTIKSGEGDKKSADEKAYEITAAPAPLAEPTAGRKGFFSFRKRRKGGQAK
jgi:uncharacterized integral membrane protein